MAGGIPGIPLPGVVRGTITRAGPVADSWHVIIPRIHGPDAELGPFQAVTGTGIAAGDRVVLAPVEGRVDDLIILGALS